MKKVETQRLILQPLQHDQLLKYSNDDQSLPQELNLRNGKRHISPSLRNALQNNILPEVHDEDQNYPFHTLWIVISKEKGQIIGDICFVGEPDLNGEIEIGYTTYPEFRGMGFMTEAVGGIIKWAEKHPKVMSIFAATSKDNVASYSILEKNNFIHVGEVDEMLNWQLILTKP